MSIPPTGKTVLVVEDDLDSREILCEFLRGEGYTLVEAVDGVTAIEELQRRRPDAILLDLRMPRLDGWGVLRWLEAHGNGVPVALTTAELTPPDGYPLLSKPLDLAALQRWLAEATRAVWCAEQ